MTTSHVSEPLVEASRTRLRGRCRHHLLTDGGRSPAAGIWSVISRTVTVLPAFEAVPEPEPEHFKAAKNQQGRLVLSIINRPC
jgi:hypothetical protein